MKPSVNSAILKPIIDLRFQLVYQNAASLSDKLVLDYTS